MNSMMKILYCLLVVCVPLFASGQNDVIFASMTDGQDLATRINCQVDEEQHFQYSSVTELWGSMGGEIVISADLILRCLGADIEGKYGADALKYNIEISNLLISEGKEREVKRRRKRGATADFFTNSWKKVKRFFKKMFGRNPPPPDETRASKDKPVSDGDLDAIDSEPEEVFSSEDLSSLYSTPFQLVQLANGTIPEIRFSENDIEDGRVKNFKRHLADAFATQLNHIQKRELEKTVMGEHNSSYNITVTGEKANLNVAGISSTSEPYKNAANKMVVVNKMVTGEDIVKFAPSEALNDKDRIDLRTYQRQIFQDGRMISSSGRASLFLAPDADDKSRRRRAAEDDATSYIHTHTSYEVQLRRRRRRSAHETNRSEKEVNAFRAASRIAEVDDSQATRKIKDLQTSTDLNLLLENLLSEKESDRDDKMQSLFEIVKEEGKLKVDNEEKSMTQLIRKTFTIEKMDNLCSKNFTICKDYLQLVALAGGPAAEQIFLYFLRNDTGRFSTEKQTIADILSDFAHPSKTLLMTLSTIFEQSTESPDFLGTLGISLGHLSSEVEVEVKNKVSDIFSRMLRDKQENCNRDPILIDLLEAIGNLRCNRIVSQVLEVSDKCKGNDAIQIACAHALRYSTDLPDVQAWIKMAVTRGDCDVVEEVVGSLMDKIQDQEMTPDFSLWPRFGFNSIDELFHKYVNEHPECSTEDILLYFSRKRNDKANQIARDHFGPDSEPWEPSTKSRQKRRAFWNDLNCQEWTEDSRYNPIQKKEEFDSDRATYNKRKSCLAFRKLGVKNANAEIYAGMFAGLKEPSDPPKYKLFTKFVSGFNFLGQQVEVGSFYFYLFSGKTKAYVRIMGRTRQEFTSEGCTPTELHYRPLKHIPLYLVSVANVQLSLGIHLSSRLSVDTLCPESDVFQLQPLTNVRIGGEALGTVLFIRGAANIGANFNYKLQFTFTPSPDMCLKGNHGFDPMGINFESYFQLWNSAKQDWGKTRVWKPNFLSWEVKKGELKQWFDDTCIATHEGETVLPKIERELE